jgi:hypothetical protein
MGVAVIFMKGQFGDWTIVTIFLWEQNEGKSKRIMIGHFEKGCVHLYI